jgi:hypothetical protein
VSSTVRRKSPLLFGFLGALVCLSLAGAGELVLDRIDLPRRPALIFRGEESDLTRRLQQAGAKSGDVQVSLSWNNRNDLDLYMADPTGAGVCLLRKRCPSGGELDVDMNAKPPFSTAPVENIHWPPGTAPRGVYRIWVQYYASHGDPDPSPFSIRVKAKGRVYHFAGALSDGDPFRYIGAFPTGDMPFDPDQVDRIGPWVTRNFTK